MFGVIETSDVPSTTRQLHKLLDKTVTYSCAELGKRSFGLQVKISLNLSCTYPVFQRTPSLILLQSTRNLHQHIGHDFRKPHAKWQQKPGNSSYLVLMLNPSVVSTGNCKLGHDCRRVCSHRRHDATRQFRRVGVDSSRYFNNRNQMQTFTIVYYVERDNL